MSPKGSWSRVWRRCASGVAELEASADERVRAAVALPDLELKDMDGLGLAVSGNLMEADGGTTKVESPSTALGTGEQSEGSTFTVVLPLAG